MKKWIGDEHRDEFQGLIEDAERKVREVEQRYLNKEDKEWNAFETADAAELTLEYRRAYFLVSGSIHSKVAKCSADVESWREGEAKWLVETSFYGGTNREAHHLCAADSNRS